MNLLYHPPFKNRSKRFKPNKPPPSHYVNEEFPEISSLVRQCLSRNINYDDNVVKIEGDFTDIIGMSLHNDKYLSDHSVIDEEYIPFDGREHDTKSCLLKNIKKRCHQNMLDVWRVTKIVMLLVITRTTVIRLLLPARDNILIPNTNG